MEKQTFQIPEGCKAITMEQIGNQLVTTFEVEFKKGDVIISKNDNDVVCVFNDFKNVDSFTEIVGLAIGGRITFFNGNWFGSVSRYRLATPEEAQRLWDYLAERDKKWNPETMQVEEIKKDRWRAIRGKWYYYFYWDMNIVTSVEDGRHLDNIRYNSGNYFRTKEQAERAKLYIQKAYNDFWKEELK